MFFFFKYKFFFIKKIFIKNNLISFRINNLNIFKYYYFFFKLNFKNFINFFFFLKIKNLSIFNLFLIKNKNICNNKTYNMFTIKFIYFFKNIYNINYNILGLITTYYIYLLDIIGTYKGWRHIKGLPTNGQNTWSNGWNSFYTNLFLRNFQIKLIKIIYKDFLFLDNKKLNLLYLSEKVNILWKNQWEKNWKFFKNKQLNFFLLNNNINNINSFKIDLIKLTQGNINILKVRKNKKLEKVKKNNIFFLGFNPNFSKYYLNSLYNNKKNIKKIDFLF